MLVRQAGASVFGLTPRDEMPITVRTIGLGPTAHSSADLTAQGSFAADCHSSLKHYIQ